MKVASSLIHKLVDMIESVPILFLRDRVNHKNFIMHCAEEVPPTTDYKMLMELIDMVSKKLKQNTLP